MVLNMEKFAIVNKRENKKFLSLPSEKVNKREKKDFFLQSYRTYNKVKKIGHVILAKYPKFKHNDEICYILAVMTIDMGNQSEIKKKVAPYLKKGIQKSKKGSPIYKKLVIKLAEHYYDQKNHSEAVRYYHEALGFKKDKWYTRYLYSIGLSLMALDRTYEAKKYIKESLTLSIRYKNYINYTEKIFDKLPIFIDEVDIKSFFPPFKAYLKKRPKDFFIKIATLSWEVGKYKLANYILDYATELSREKGNADDVFRFQMVKMDLYLEVKKDKVLITYTRNFVEKNKHSLKKKQKKEIVERIKRHIRVLQDNKNPKNLKDIIFNFNTLKILDPKNSISYFFLEGEVYFSYKKYNQAFITYKVALEKIKKSGGNPAKNPLTKKVFDSIIKSLEKGSFSNKKIESYNIYVYKNHLRIFPVNKRSQKMYQRLFNIYFKNKDYTKCEKVLSLYMKRYPHKDKNKNPMNAGDIKNQQFMLSQIIDNYLDTGKTKKAKFWVDRMKEKHFSFDRKYIVKASTILVISIYNNIWKIPNLDKQNKQYQKVYKNKYVRKNIRADSAYFIGKNNLKLLKTKESFLWLQKSLKLLSSKERIKRQKDFLAFVLQMVHLQDFSSARNLATTYFSKHCKNKHDLKKDFYNATVLYALLDNKNDLAVKNFEQGKVCDIPMAVQETNLKTMIGLSMTQRNYTFFEELLQKYNSSETLRSHFTQELLKIYWEAFISKSHKGQNFAFFYLKQNFPSMNEEVKAVIKFHDFREKIEKQDDYYFAFQDANMKVEVKNKAPASEKKSKKKVYEEKFDEDLFNKEIEKSLQDINAFKAEIEQHINTGYPHIILYGLKHLRKRYYVFSRTLLKFTPKGVDANYKKGFLEAMQELSNQLSGEAKKYERETFKISQKNNLLYSDKEMPLLLQPVYLSVSNANNKIRGK